MKKPTTYYFLALALLNALFGFFMVELGACVTDFWQTQLEGLRIPVLVQFHSQTAWWPYSFAVLSVVGLVLSFTGKAADRLLLQCCIVGLMVELILMFSNILSYSIPFLPSPCDGSCLRQ